MRLFEKNVRPWVDVRNLRPYYVGEGWAQGTTETEGNIMSSTTTTIETITNEQIEALRAEGGTAGDMDMVEICDKALEGDEDAIIECVEVINYAEVAWALNIYASSIYPTAFDVTVASVHDYITACGNNSDEETAAFIAQGRETIISEMKRDGWALPAVEAGEVGLGDAMDAVMDSLGI